MVVVAVVVLSDYIGASIRLYRVNRKEGQPYQSIVQRGHVLVLLC